MKPVVEQKEKRLKSHELTMLKHNDVTIESESDKWLVCNGAKGKTT